MWRHRNSEVRGTVTSGEVTRRGARVERGKGKRQRTNALEGRLGVRRWLLFWGLLFQFGVEMHGAAADVEVPAPVGEAFFVDANPMAAGGH